MDTRRRRRKVILKKAWPFLCIFIAGFLCAQEPEEPIPFLLTPAQDTALPWAREARAKFFNLRGGYSMIDPPRAPGPPGAPPPPPPVVTVTFANQAEMPHADADSVVVGTVLHVQPFLTADNNGIYTEYTLVIAETIKNKASTSVFPGDSLTLMRRGGVARLADGRVIQHHVSNDIIPGVGQQYLGTVTE